MLLYNSPDSGNCYKVRWLLTRLGIPYERRDLSVVDRSDRPGVLGGLNPALRVPTLVLDDGRALGESNAIAWFLAEDTPLVPDDRFLRAQVLQWMFFEQYELEPAIAVLRFWLTLSGRPQDFADRIPERTEACRRVLGILDGHLRDRAFTVGDTLTLADICVYAYTHVAGDAGIDPAAFPAVHGWLERVAAQPGHVLMSA